MIVSFYRNTDAPGFDIDLNAEEISALLSSDQFIINELREDDMDQLKVINSIFKKEPGRTRLLVTYELLKYPNN